MPDDTEPTPAGDAADRPPAVACTLTPDRVTDRTDDLATLAAGFRGTEELPDGYALRFDGGDEVFDALAAFVVDERRCCAFAAYALETAPPYEETRLAITGPDGTKTVFGEGLIDRLDERGG